MSYHNAWVSGCRRVGIAVFGSVVFMGALSLSARAGTYSMVDAETGTGDMVISVDTADSSYGSGAWTISLVATNTGTQTYKDVSLVGQFVWDKATSPFTALGYTSSNNWAGSGDNFSISQYQITSGTNAGLPQPPVPILVSSTNDPLSWGDNVTEGIATVQSTDYCPDIPLGDFGPGASETFTITCPSNPFYPQATGFFVVPSSPRRSRY